MATFRTFGNMLNQMPANKLEHPKAMDMVSQLPNLVGLPPKTPQLKQGKMGAKLPQFNTWAKMKG